jgi:hypothetical protein
MILDRFDDKGAYLKEIKNEVGGDSAVKLASNESPRSGYPEDFALRLASRGGTEYRYQTTDEAETVSSVAYFGKYGHQLPKPLQKIAAENLKNSLEAFGLHVPVDVIKTASMELGFTHENPEFTLEALFAGDDVDVIEDAFNACTPRGKRRLMLQVKEASASFFPGDNHSAADVGSDLVLAFDLRKLRVGDDAKESLDELFAKTASMEPEEVVRRLESFDKQNQLCHLYGRFVPDPVESVFGQAIEKVANDRDEVIDINGASVVATEFKDFVDSNYDTLETSFGEDFANQLKADPVPVYNSLPVTYKKAIGSIYNKD